MQEDNWKGAAMKRDPKVLIRGTCFFFQAEDGIRDVAVTGVQTCALPISQPLGFAGAGADRDVWLELLMGSLIGPRLGREALTFVHGYPATQAALARLDPREQIGRASCRGRG